MERCNLVRPRPTLKSILTDFREDAKIELCQAIGLSPHAVTCTRRLSLTCGTGVWIKRGHIAKRLSLTVSKSNLVFTEEPSSVIKTIYFKVVKARKRSNLILGVTSCNPLRLDGCSLPTDPFELVDRKEYWVLQRMLGSLDEGDFFSVAIRPTGLFTVQRNKYEREDLFYCDVTQRLWFFFDLGPDFQDISLIGDSLTQTAPTFPHGSIWRQRSFRLNTLEQAHSSSQTTAKRKHTRPVMDALLSSTAAGDVRKVESAQTASETASKCSVCISEDANVAIYDCGHKCLCMKCGRILLKEKAFPKCPICRKPIKDVLRIYTV